MVAAPLHITRSEAETERAAALLGERLQGGDVIALGGELGAGKTCFVRGLARGLAVPGAPVASPTFALIHEYRGGRLTLYHVDLYRIADARELQELGLEELMEGQVACAIEWAERFPEVLPPAWIEVRIELVSDGERRLHIRGVGARGLELADAWHQALAPAERQRDVEKP